MQESLVHFLALGDGPFETLVLQACHVYAVKRAVDTRRHKKEILDSAGVSRLIFEGHRTAALHSAPLRRLYAQIWNST